MGSYSKRGWCQNKKDKSVVVNFLVRSYLVLVLTFCLGDPLIIVEMVVVNNVYWSVASDAERRIKETEEMKISVIE